MATLTRTHPTAVARGTIQELTSLSLFKVVLSGSGLAVAASDAAAVKVIRRFRRNGPILFNRAMVMNYMVADNHAVDIDTIARQIGLVLDTGTLGALIHGEQTLSDPQTVTVTKPTDIEAIQ